MLEDKFKLLCQNFTHNTKIINQLWLEIEREYSSKNRYYHTLRHLQSIYKVLEPFKLDTLLEFSIFYHDIIYDVKASNNEEQSAFFAKKSMKQLNVPTKLQEEVFNLIIETKTHQTNCEENALFIDADLAILGSSKKNYQEYILNIRKEYAHYSDKIYKNSRKKVLESFLKEERIYKSKHFYEYFEEQAKSNIKSEINSLSIS